MSDGDSNQSSQSNSSGSSSNQPYFNLDSKESLDLSLTLNRSGTVRRVSNTSKRDDENKDNEEEMENVNTKLERMSPDAVVPEKVRRSMDSSYRQSLESIHEYRAKTSFSSASTGPTRGSIDSTSSEVTDIAQDKDPDKTSQTASYMSWIESEYFGSSSIHSEDYHEYDSKVGEWNNFWLNYTSARSNFNNNPYFNLSTETKKVCDLSEAKSTCNTQREFMDKNPSNSVMLTVDELNESVKCSQRITEILQNALRRNDQDLEDSINSYYSQSFTRHNSSIRDDDVTNVISRERSFSYAMDIQEVQKQQQKMLLKNAPQSSSTSCINALLNTGVGDILKRVMPKKRDSMTPSEEKSISRIFPDWASAK
ncbi:unnamed protein product [Brassicogethes aeneus]|uniref:Uncharacterized protein n=1 Tax=Brassicogethes aeneus TaxID=1431903 RepID=A0A9P0ARD1_BRAAE|nr:unnamed protein product [Brassicogethes aeneus]